MCYIIFKTIDSAHLTLSSELDLDTLVDVGAVEFAAAISNMGVMVRSAACHTSGGSSSSKSSRRSEAAVVTWSVDVLPAEAGVTVGTTTADADSPPLLITSSTYQREVMQVSCKLPL